MVGPSCIVFEVCREESEPLAGIGTCVAQHGADTLLARQRADRGANRIPALEELQNDVTSNEPRAAGDQHCVHVKPFYSRPSRPFSLQMYT